MKNSICIEDLASAVINDTEAAGYYDESEMCFPRKLTQEEVDDLFSTLAAQAENHG